MREGGEGRTKANYGITLRGKATRSADSWEQREKIALERAPGEEGPRRSGDGRGARRSSREKRPQIPW